MLRAGLISLIYRQTIKLHMPDFEDKPAITLTGTDVERIVATLHGLHEAWAAPLEVGVGLYLLERQLGVACLIPAAVSLGTWKLCGYSFFLCLSIIVTVLATIPISQRSNIAFGRWIENVQTRLGITSSMLHDMKAVKMLGLSSKLFDCVSRLRLVELQVSERFRTLLVGQVILCRMTTYPISNHHGHANL